MMKRIVALAGLAMLLGVGCVAPTESEGPDSKAAPAPQAKDVAGEVKFDVLTKDRVAGSYTLKGHTVTFETEIVDDVPETTFSLRDMTLVFTADPVTGVFDVDGFNEKNGEDTSMTEPDRVLIHSLDAALKDMYLAKAKDLKAFDFLVRNITLWTDYSDTFPLKRTFYGRFETNNVGTGVNLCNLVNRKGAYGYFRKGTHDCAEEYGDCPDCNCVAWVCSCTTFGGGCNGGEDNSSSDYVFMSMHPSGPCSDSTWFGNNPGVGYQNGSGSLSCFEPNHPSDMEYVNGACMGRCGATCGSSTVFSQACLDHDMCVSFGHANASAWCDDDFVNASWDYTWMSNCNDSGYNVNFPADGQYLYNWSSRGNNPACPTSWNFTNDGCDANCQFIDYDCFR